MKQMFRQRLFVFLLFILTICAISDPGKENLYFMFFVLNFSMALFRSIASEKESRLAEYYISIFSPTKLLLGKIKAYAIFFFVISLLINICAVAGLLRFVDVSFLPCVSMLCGWQVFVQLLGCVFYLSLVAFGASYSRVHTEMQGSIFVIAILMVSSYFVVENLADIFGNVLLCETLLKYIPFTMPFVKGVGILPMCVSFVAIIFILKFSGKIYKKRLFYYGKNKITEG